MGADTLLQIMVGYQPGERVEMRKGVVGAWRSTKASEVVIASWPSLRLALRVLLLLLALGVTLGRGVDNRADKEAYHDDHNLLKEPRQPVLLLPGTTERTEREREELGQ